MTNFEDVLRSERQRLTEYLAGESSPNFSSQIVRMQSERRLQDVDSELAAQIAGRIEIRWSRASDPGSPRLETSVLGTLLTRVQTSFNYLLWANESGPGVEGAVPASILRSARTEAVAIAPGSFTVVLEKSEPEISEAFDKSVSVVMDLLDAASVDAFGNDVEESVAGLGREATVRLEKLFRRMHVEGLRFNMDWHRRGVRAASVTSDEAGVLAEWLAQVSPESNEIQVKGLLKMADSDSARFALEAEDGIRYEGRSDVDLAHVEIEAVYEASLLVVTSRSSITRGASERVTLLALQRSSSSSSTTT